MSEDKNSEIKYVMVESGPSVEDDEIDLLELIRTLLHAWKTIACITILCLGLTVAYALHLPVVFKAETLLAPTQEGKLEASSALLQFGGLASMAGMSMPTDSNIEKVVATLNSRKFIRAFLHQKKLVPILFEEIWDSENQTWLVESSEEEPSDQKAIDFFKSCLSVEKDMESGLITLSISWKDPKIAAQWTNDLVRLLNEQLRQKAIADSIKRVGYLEQELAKTTLHDTRAVLYNLLESEKQKAMLANVNEDFALEVIDPAIVPEIRDKPNRKTIIALGGVCGGFLGVFAVFFFQFVQKMKSSNQEDSECNA